MGAGVKQYIACFAARSLRLYGRGKFIAEAEMLAVEYIYTDGETDSGGFCKISGGFIFIDRYKREYETEVPHRFWITSFGWCRLRE